jgi:phosphate transport system permease protein
MTTETRAFEPVRAVETVAVDVRPAGSTAGTTVPAYEPVDQGVREERRSLSAVRAGEVLSVVGAMAAAAATTWLAFGLILPVSGTLGSVIVGVLLFLLYYGVLCSIDNDGAAVRDRIAAAVIHVIAAVLLLALVFVVTFTIYRGLKALPHQNFYTQDMTKAGPLQPLSVGGILHAVIGTAEQITIALVITIPLGLLCAVFLTVSRGPFPRLVRTIVEAMTALPSIVAGLFIYATLILALGFEKSGFAASLALSVMMLPIIIRAADVVLRIVPGTLQEASFALGAPQWRTVWHVVLPTARSGLMTAIILGTARGIGETSPVLLTAGFTATVNKNPFHGPMVSLPLATFEFVRSPQPAMIARGFGTAAFLMLLVLVLFLTARAVGGRGPGQLSRRQASRVARVSRRDHERLLLRRDGGDLQLMDENRARTAR